MTSAQEAEICALHAKGCSLYYIATCVDGVTYQEVENLLGMPTPNPDKFSPALRAWWNQQPWVWRPDNRNPIEAPWERVVE